MYENETVPFNRTSKNIGSYFNVNQDYNSQQVSAGGTVFNVINDVNKNIEAVGQNRADIVLNFTTEEKATPNKKESQLEQEENKSKNPLDRYKNKRFDIVLGSDLDIDEFVMWFNDSNDVTQMKEHDNQRVHVSVSISDYLATINTDIQFKKLVDDKFEQIIK